MTVRKYSPKRRRLYRNGEQIDRLSVFERDNWICYLCNQTIDSTLRFPDRMAATIEHIIPLALGGTHTYDNVAASHALCNFKKGCNSDWTAFNS
jgi:5-methylcytosine-specific restriction endonuclease McrA